MSEDELKIFEALREMIRLTNERVSSLERVVNALVETHLAQSDALIQLQKDANARMELEALSQKWHVQ